MWPVAPTLQQTLPLARHTPAFRAIVVAVAALAASALPTRTHAYRTLADDPALPLSAPAAFRGPVVWNVAVGDIDDGEIARITQASRLAFAAWSAPACSQFRHQQVDGQARAVPGDGTSTVELVRRDWASRGFNTGEAAFADVQMQDSATGFYILEADIYLDWATIERNSSVDLQALLTHEVGHLLGLIHPCEIASAPECTPDPTLLASSLYPVHQGTSQRELSSDDIAGVCALYNPTGCTRECPSGTRCIQHACVSGAGDADAGMPGVPSDAATAQCSTNADCAWGACVVSGPQLGMCGPRGSLGTSCRMGEECTSNTCLLTGTIGYCSSLCEHGCATDMQCVEIGAQNVCAFDSPRPGTSGCSVSPAQTRPSLWIVALAVLSFSLVRRRSARNPLLATRSLHLPAQPSAIPRTDASTAALDSGATRIQCEWALETRRRESRRHRRKNGWREEHFTRITDVAG